MATKLYPPQLEGTLPAFYKTYDVEKKTVLKGANITIPFGMNRAVSQVSIDGMFCRIRTMATNTYIVAKETLAPDWTNQVVNINLDAEEAAKINEGQYYKVQLAFIDAAGVVGYFSSIGVIKCVAKPTVSLANFNTYDTNQYNNEFVGVYEQDTTYGDSTEKVYSYEFNLWDSDNNLLATSGVQVHDSTQDVSSYASRDIFRTYKIIPDGTMGYIQYTVTTLNNLTISSPKYQVMKSVSVDPERPIKIIAEANFEDGYVLLSLEGETVQDISGVWHEAGCTGTFIITRGSDQDNWIEWEEITRFVIASGYPSSYSFKDFTVQQGINYRYAIQQYNMNGIYSNRILSKNHHKGDLPTALYDEPTLADFEDMYLYDGKRQLKIRFNPKVDSFKNTIPEQKIETIGSKYPFIFRNGNVCYKEFPIAGLITFQEDESTLFLDDEELRQAGILEQEAFRTHSGFYPSSKKHIVEQNYNSFVEKTELRDPVTGAILYDPRTHEKLYKYTYRYERKTGNEPTQIVTVDYNDSGDADTESGSYYEDKIVRMNKDLTSENIMGERYFKLKVLDWLTDGNVKLFRSPSEGNYLVRLLNVSMKPQDSLGRMIHDFSCVGYEIAELTYDNLVAYGIVNNSTPTLMETHWSSIDLPGLLIDKEPDTWVEIPTDGVGITDFSLTGFAPGDKVKIVFADDVEANSVIMTIGTTGTFNYSYDDRTIASIYIMKNPEAFGDFDRNIVFAHPGILTTNFDEIAILSSHTQVAEEFVGPKENLLADYDLCALAAQYESPPTLQLQGEEILRKNLYDQNNINYCLGSGDKIKCTKVEILNVRKRPAIPIYATEDLLYDTVAGTFKTKSTTKYAVTPFGIGYVNYKMITEPGRQANTMQTIQTTDVVPIGNKVNALDVEELRKAPDQFLYYDQNRVVVNGFTIFKVYLPQRDGDKYTWVESDQAGAKYYDTFTGAWWEGDEEYDPTFSINSLEVMPKMQKPKSDDELMAEGETPFRLVPTDVQWNNIVYSESAYRKYKDIDIDENDQTNKISLNEIEEITLRNLGDIEKITLGNGVMAEITCQLKVVDYLLEDTDPDVKRAKDAYKGTDVNGNPIGATADMANALSTYMTKYNDIQKARKEIIIKQEQIQTIHDQILEYYKAIEETDKLRNGTYRRLQSYMEELYYDIQGTNLNTTTYTDPWHEQRLGEIFKYLRELKNTDGSPYWPSDGRNFAGSVYRYLIDNNGNYILQDVANNKQYNLKTITTLNPATFTLLQSEIVPETGLYRFANGDEMKKQIKQIAFDSLDTDQPGLLTDMRNIFKTILIGSAASATREASVIEQINNQVPKTDYGLVVPGTPFSENEVYYNKTEDGKFVINKYVNIAVWNMDVNQQKVYKQGTTYGGYKKWLREKILGVHDKTGDIPGMAEADVYYYLHHFDVLPEDLRYEVLTPAEYGQMFFIGSKDSDYDWTGINTEVGKSNEFFFLQGDNIYADTSESGHGLFQGLIVDQYDEALVTYKEYKRIKDEYDALNELFSQYSTQYILVTNVNSYNAATKYYNKSGDNYVYNATYANNQTAWTTAVNNRQVYIESQNYLKSQRWDLWEDTKTEAKAEQAYWYGVINAGGVVIDTGSEYLAQIGKEAEVDELLAYAQKRVLACQRIIDTCESAIANEKDAFDQYIDLRNRTQNAETASTNLLAQLRSQINAYKASVNYYMTHISHLESQGSTSELTLIELVTRYQAIKNSGQGDSYLFREDAAYSELVEAISDFNKYLKYINDMEYLPDNTSTGTGQLIADFNSTVELWEELKTFTTYYDNNDINNLGLIQIATKKISELEEELEELSKIANQDIATEFDNETYINKIKDALATYLFALGLAYLNKVERRYG